ncbi:MAG: glycine oxidase ThiO [Gammaproteobacteria bacterium]
MTKKANKKVDVLIVGGGIIGMLTARNLANQGLNIALIDKGKLGGEATWAAGGILSPLNPWQETSETKLLINEGRQNFATLAEELKQETNIDPQLIKSGMLVLNVDEKQQALDWAKQNNEPIEVLKHLALRGLVPNLSEDIDEALFLPNIEQIRPPRLIAALQQSLHLRRVNVYEHTAVTKILVEANSITGVATEFENISAGKVILCSGAWTKNLLPNNSAIKHDIEPVRGQMLLYQLPETTFSQIVMQENSYLIPRLDGHILCGSTVEHVGFENKITQEALTSLQNIAHNLVPLLASHQPIKQWSALRPGTQRNAPYICKHPTIAGLYINSGHYRYGITMSIASARIMLELITDSLNSSQTVAYA